MNIMRNIWILIGLSSLLLSCHSGNINNLTPEDSWDVTTDTLFTQTCGQPTALSIVYAVATDANGNVYAGGQTSESNGAVYQCLTESSVWQQIGNNIGAPFMGNRPQSINSLLLIGDGRLMAGDNYGGVSFINLNTSTDQDWTTIKSGSNSNNLGFVGFQAMALNNNGQVAYIAGQSNSAPYNDLVESVNVANLDSQSLFSQVGNSGFAVYTDGGNSLRCLIVGSDGSLYTAGYLSIVYKLLPGSTTWESAPSINGNTSTAINILGLALDRKGNLYAAGQGMATVWKAPTTNWGQNTRFTQFGGNLESQNDHVSAIHSLIYNGGYIVAGATDSSIFALSTSNGGSNESWLWLNNHSSIGNPAPVWSMFVIESTLYSGFGNGSVYQVTY